MLRDIDRAGKWSHDAMEKESICIRWPPTPSILPSNGSVMTIDTHTRHQHVIFRTRFSRSENSVNAVFEIAIILYPGRKKKSEGSLGI